MNFNIEESLTYFYKDKEWIRKAGVIFIIQIGIGVIGGVFRFIGNLTSYVPDILPYYTSMDPESIEYLMAYMAPYMVSFLISLLTIPFGIYIAGYLLETRKNVMNEEENPAPENDNIWNKLKLALGAIVVTLGPVLTVTLLAAFLIVPLILIGVAQSDNSAGSVLIMLILMLTMFLGFIYFCLLLFIYGLIVPSMLYLYLKTDSITQAYDYAAVWAVTKAGWKRIIVVSLIMYALGVLSGLLGLVLCFIGFIVQPIIQTWLMFTEAHLFGTVYKQLDDEGVVEFESGV